MRPDRVQWQDGKYVAHFGSKYVYVEQTQERNYSGIDSEDWAAAYVLAASLLPPAPARVIDAGCGSGYGAEILADAGYAVLAFDIHEPTIEFARLRCETAWFKVGDISQFSVILDPYSADAIVAIESIEHVHDDMAMYCGFARTLCPGGTLFVCTPDRDLLGDTAGTNPFHIREYTNDELRNCLTEAGFVNIHAVDIRSHGYKLSMAFICKTQ